MPYFRVTYVVKADDMGDVLARACWDPAAECWVEDYLELTITTVVEEE